MFHSDANSILYRITGSDDFAAVIVTTMAAYMMRALKFPTIAAFRVSLRCERMVAAAHAAA